MELILIILIAAAVAGTAWVLIVLITNRTATDRDKLQERLSSETNSDLDERSSRSLSLRETRTGLPGFLNSWHAIQLMQRRVSQGYPDTPLARFLLIQAGLAAAGFVIGGALSGSGAMGSIAAAVGAFLPMFVLNLRRNGRKQRIAMQLPEALDFLSRVLRSGQSFSTGMQMISEELPQPLAGEFRRCYDQHSLGQPLEDGLRDMAASLNSQDFAFFATAVIIQRQSGGDLAEVLRNISDMVRKRQRLQQTVKAKTAEGRFTGYIMVAFPGIMFVLAYVMNPDYGNVLLHTGTGHGLLLLAGGLCAFGLFLIKRITTIRV
jgi:tight adherence protein B